MPLPQSKLCPITRLGLGLVLASTLACRTSSVTVQPDYVTPPNALAEFPSPNYWHLERPIVPLVSAHRAQPEVAGYPENSLAGIDYLTREGSFILELDVAMSADSVLFLFHDDNLERLTDHEGAANARTWSALDTMRLRDRFGARTRETIPTLREALTLARERALLTLDLKGDVPFESVLQAVETYGDPATTAIILYDADDLERYARLDAPTAASYSATTPKQVSFAKSNLGETELVIFGGVGFVPPLLVRAARNLRLRTIVGTFGELDDQAVTDGGQTYRDLTRRGLTIIATNRPLAAYDALKEMALPRSQQLPEARRDGSSAQGRASQARMQAETH